MNIALAQERGTHVMNSSLATSVSQTSRPSNTFKSQFDDSESSKLQSSAHSIRHIQQSSPGINLAGIDLNLFVSLDALLEHCNVTHAGDAVGLSQPAMSRALSRLRGMFNDDLLVRTSMGYVRTVRGEQLHERLPAMLDAVRDLVASRSAGADQWKSTFRLAMPDHQALVLAIQMRDRMNDELTNTDIVIEPLSHNLSKKIENGELEIAIGQLSASEPGFFQRTLYKDPYACLVRDDHPVLEEAWSQDQFYELRHAVIAPQHDGERSFVTDALASVPLRRRCVLSPNLMGTAMAVVESDMILTLPNRVATKLAKLLPLKVLNLPVEAPPYEVVLLWHERSHRSPAHSRIRSQIAATAQFNPI
jgi:DNA-binding transcriptional LysR family regulator